MPNQGQRQDYLWRPNDNSSTTLTRYDQEAEHWYRAFKNAEEKNKPVDYQNTFTTIGLLISLIFSLLSLITIGLIQFIKWLRS